MSQDATLRKILDAVYRMAVRKKKANESRPDGEKYAELQRVRLGSRLLAYLPMRVTPELVDILRDFKEKAAQVGVKQFIYKPISSLLWKLLRKLKALLKLFRLPDGRLPANWYLLWQLPGVVIRPN